MVNGLSSEDVQRASVYRGTVQPQKPVSTKPKEKKKLGFDLRDLGDLAFGMACGAGLDALFPNILEQNMVGDKCIEAFMESLPYGMGVLIQSKSPKRAGRSTGVFMIGSVLGQAIYQLAMNTQIFSAYFQ